MELVGLSSTKSGDLNFLLECLNKKFNTNFTEIIIMGCTTINTIKIMIMDNDINFNIDVDVPIPSHFYFENSNPKEITDLFIEFVERDIVPGREEILLKYHNLYMVNEWKKMTRPEMNV